MPLLRRQPFKRQPVPSNLRPNEELFFCKLTNEVFRDYDAFFERVILCNSLVWICELTGRPGLTYLEAIESEERARTSLKAMPISIRKPLLYLAYISKCGRLSDLCDDVFLYAKDRFFVNEEVDALIDGQRKPCKIVKIVPPSGGSSGSKRKQSFSKLMNNENSDDEESADANSNSHFDPAKCQYMVLDCNSSDREIHLLSPEDILRKKGIFSREKNKLFLKQTCHLSGCQWAVKEKFVEKYGVSRMKFRDIFAGAKPNFESPPSKKKGIVLLPSQQAAAATSKSKGKEAVDSKKKGEASKASQGSGKTTNKNSGYCAAASGGSDSKKLSNKVKQQIAADEAATKLAEAMALLEEKRRSKEELRVRMEEERKRRKEEKDKEREQQKEERRIMAECLKEWQKPRDDLECDDLLDLPAPLPVVCGIPNEFFGDAAMLLEFVHSFADALETSDHFPHGLTLELLERALVERDVQGPLNDLLQLLIRATFRFQEEDEDDDGAQGASCSDGAVTTDVVPGVDLNVSQALKVASAASNWPVYCHGSSLRKLALDAFTLTEVLRLHLLSSGARKNPEDPTSSDDPGLCLWLQEPELMRTLAHTNVFDLTAGDKLKILRSLAEQLLGYYTLREEVEENLDKARVARSDLKMMQWAEQRREREEASLRFKKKMEERAIIKAEMEPNAQPDKKDPKKDDKKAPPLPPKKSLTPDEQKLEDEKLAALESKRKQEFFKREKEMVDNLSRWQGRGALLPIGRDRAYRRFWMFATLPGLFVEDDDPHLGPCPPEATPYNPNSNPYSSFNSSVSQARFQQLAGAGEAAPNGDKENSAVRGMAVAPPNGPIVVLHKNHKLLSDNHPTASVLVNGVIESVKLKAEAADGALESINGDTDITGKPTVFGMCNALGDACPVHGRKPEGSSWSFYSTTTQVESLIAALNPRGFREGSLKEILVADKRRVLLSVGKCPVSRLNLTTETGGGEDNVPEVRKSNRNQTAGTTYPPGTTMEDFLELTMRDSIVDMEDKIHAGGLGSIKVWDRTAWREAIIQHSYDMQCDKLTWGVKLENRNKLVLGGSSTSESVDSESAASSNPKPCRVGSPVPVKSVVSDLASALLQIFQGIELKYLTPPLAGDKDGPSHKTASERWEEALMSCTSLSQVFLFFTTLEKSVAWSRSALNARCRICRRRGDAEHMLLCDECDRGHHMYCLKPRLKSVPKGEWLCPDCKPVEKPKKNRKRRMTLEEDEEEDILAPKVEPDDDGSDPEFTLKKKREEPKKAHKQKDTSKRDPPPKRDTAKRDSSKRDTPTTSQDISKPGVLCDLCKKDGELVVCCGCSLGYHPECADPPFRRSSKGRWRCLKCGGTAAAQVSMDINLDSSRASTGRSSLLGRLSRSKREASPVSHASKKVALKSKISSNDASIRRSARNAGRDTNYKRHSKYDSDEDWGTKSPRRSNRRSREDLSDDEYYGLAKRQTPPNRRGASNDVPLDYKICDQLLTELVRHEDSWPFLRPVGKKEIPLYHQVIKCPMDFGTMRSKLNTSSYTDNKQFVKDVFLIFQNCCIFNPADSLQYKASEILGRMFHRRLRELGLQLVTEEELRRRIMTGLPPARDSASSRRRAVVVAAATVVDSDSDSDEMEETDEEEEEEIVSGSEDLYDDADRVSDEVSNASSSSSPSDRRKNRKVLVITSDDDGGKLEERESEFEQELDDDDDDDDEIVELEEESVAEQSDEDGRGCGGRLVIDCNGYEEGERSNSSLSNVEH